MYPFIYIYIYIYVCVCVCVCVCVYVYCTHILLKMTDKDLVLSFSFCRTRC